MKTYLRDPASNKIKIGNLYLRWCSTEKQSHSAGECNMILKNVISFKKLNLKISFQSLWYFKLRDRWLEFLKWYYICSLNSYSQDNSNDFWKRYKWYSLNVCILFHWDTIVLVIPCILFLNVIRKHSHRAWHTSLMQYESALAAWNQSLKDTTNQKTSIIKWATQPLKSRYFRNRFSFYFATLGKIWFVISFFHICI